MSTQPLESQTDRLAAAVAGPEDHETITALWRAAFGLDQWYAIPVQGGGISGPATVVIDGRRMILAFTTADAIRQFMVRQDLGDPDSELAVLAVRPEDAMSHADAYAAAGISGILMDAADSSFFMPVESMAPMWERATGRAATA